MNLSPPPLSHTNDENSPSCARAVVRRMSGAASGSTGGAGRAEPGVAWNVAELLVADGFVPAVQVGSGEAALAVLERDRTEVLVVSLDLGTAGVERGRMHS